MNFSVAGIFCEEFWAVALGGGLYRGGTLQHWYFTVVGIFSSQHFFLLVLTTDCVIFSLLITYHDYYGEK